MKKLFFFMTLCLLSVTSAAAQPGSLDPAFGNGGKIIGESIVRVGNTNLSDENTDVAVQTDGKIIAVGTIGNSIAVVRYNANGTLDTTFGTNGIAAANIYSGVNSTANAVKIQPDGKIVVGGSTNTQNFSLVDQTDFALVRLNSNGSLDTTFGSGTGKIAVNGGSIDRIKEIALQPDGKIVFTGELLDRRGSGFYIGRGIFAMRLNSNGTTDSTFGNDGTAIAPSFSAQPSPCLNCGEESKDLALQADGKIVVIGSVSAFNAPSFQNGLGIVRFLANGQLDNSFGTGGKTFTVFQTEQNPLSYDFRSVALQTDGKIVVGGKGTPSGSSSDFALFRYTTTGELDNSFGTGGKVLFSIESGNDAVNDVIIQQNGKIVAVGESSVSVNGVNITNFAVARFNRDGSPDTTFNGNGKVFTDINNGDLDSISRAVIQPDGKILAVGSTRPNTGSESISKLALARYIGDALVNRRARFDFDGDGKTDYAVFRPSSGVWYLQNSTSGFSTAQLGINSDKLTPADFDGDGKTDIAVFRSGIWYLLQSKDGFKQTQFGQAGDVPVPADFDGDGKADLAVYRDGGANGGQSFFYYLGTLNNPNKNITFLPFGSGGDKPVVGDYDGDGKADPGVYRNGVWYLLRSQAGAISIQFGIASDKTTPADYDGDGKTDLAVYRNGVWYVLQSSDSQVKITQFGLADDKPTVGDYDGDGKADISVWRASNGVFYVLGSQTGFTAFQFGLSGDVPIASAYVQ